MDYLSGVVVTCGLTYMCTSWACYIIVVQKLVCVYQVSMGCHVCQKYFHNAHLCVCVCVCVCVYAVHDTVKRSDTYSWS